MPRSAPPICELTALNGIESMTEAIVFPFVFIKPGNPYKLPTFHLLDSISKNIGHPYTVIFGRWIQTTFTHVYRLTDGVTRTKLGDMLKTWRSYPPPYGSELFGQQVQKNLEMNIFGPPAVSTASIVQARRPNGHGQERAPTPNTVQPLSNHMSQQSYVAQRIRDLLSDSDHLAPQDVSVLNQVSASLPAAFPIMPTLSPSLSK